MMEPAFVCGAGRSGTTLAIDMIGLHRDLSPVYETVFIVDLWKAIAQKQPEQITAVLDSWTKPLPFRPHEKREHEKYHHGPHYILFDRPFAMKATEELIGRLGRGNDVEHLRAFLTTLFEEHARLDKKPHWVNKTPMLIDMLGELVQIFPAMKIINCIRDGRDVACSVLSRSWGPSTVSGAAKSWQTRIEAGRTFQRGHPSQYFELRYEDLLQTPAETLDAVFGWLGVGKQGAAIIEQHYRGEISLEGFPVGRWKTELSAADIETYESLAGDTLRSLRYL